MLDRERKPLDLQEVWISELAIEIDTQGMCGQLSIQACDEPSERMRMIGLDTDLFAQLPIYPTDDLSGGAGCVAGGFADGRAGCAKARPLSPY